MKKFFVFCAFFSAASLFGNAWGDREFTFEGKTYANVLHLADEYLPENPMVLEAGARDGADTLKMSKFWSGGHIYTFEPQPKLVKKTKKRVKGRDNVTIFPYALNSYTGRAKFYQNAKRDGASSLLESTDRYRGVLYVDTEIEVPCITVADWMEQEEVDRIDFIWFDMEGAELYVLQHSGDLLNQASAIFIEMNFREFRKGMSQYEDVAALLQSYGFINLCMRGGVGQKNALFVKERLNNCFADRPSRKF